MNARWLRAESPSPLVAKPPSNTICIPKRDRAALSNILLGLCQRVSGDLGRKSYLGKTIGIKLRYDDFRTVPATSR